MMGVAKWQLFGLFLSTVGPALGSQDKPPLYETSGRSLSKVLADLSPLVHVRLDASTNLQADVIAMRIDGATIEQSLDRLAIVEGAKWSKGEGAWKLTVATEDNDAALRWRHARIVAAFKASLDRKREQLQHLPPFDQGEANRLANQLGAMVDLKRYDTNFVNSVKAFATRSPAGRALSQVLCSLDPQIFSDGQVRIRTTLSTHPNGSEVAIPASAEAAIEEYVTNQGYWARATKEAHFENGLHNGNLAPLPPDLMDWVVPSGPPANALLNLVRYSQNGGVQATLKVFDAQGIQIEKTTERIDPTFPEIPIQGLDSIESTLRFEPTAAAREIAVRRQAVSPEVAKQLLDPEQVEPLSLGYGANLLMAAKASNRNLIANLSDEIFDGGIPANVSAVSVHDFLAGLAKRRQKLVVDGAWLSVSLTDPVGVREVRADREEMGQMLRTCGTSSPTLEEKCHFALALPDPSDNRMPATILGRLRGEPSAIRDIALLRLFGSMSVEQRQEALQGSGLAASNLNDTGREALYEVMLGPFDALKKRDPNAGPAGDLWREPAELLPNGLDSSTVIHLAVHSEDFVFDTSRDFHTTSQSESAVRPGELAYIKFQASRPDLFPNDYQKFGSPDDAKYRLGSLQTYNFDIDLTSNVVATGMIEGRTLSDGGALSFNQLPASYLNTVNSTFAELSKDAENSIGPQHSTPPPNP